MQSGQRAGTREIEVLPRVATLGDMDAAMPGPGSRRTLSGRTARGVMRVVVQQGGVAAASLVLATLHWTS